MTVTSVSSFWEILQKSESSVPSEGADFLVSVLPWKKQYRLVKKDLLSLVAPWIDFIPHEWWLQNT